MEQNMGTVVKLKCHYNNYSWGKKGELSEVARLFKAHMKGFRIDEDKPYSELWMGTHPDGPARVHNEQDMTLSRFIAKSHSESYLRAESNNNQERSEIHLPFIMKIMSINQALSLQVHPTKEQAARLHAEDPINYPDRNHKPELAYALSDFELLCGFRPAHEMRRNLQAFKSLYALFGDSARDLILCSRNPDSREARYVLKQCFEHMIYVQNPQIYVQELLRELDNGVRGAIQEETVAVIRKIAAEFPNDIGAFSPVFLNHMMLKPGECCYYAAEELHAYLSGECVECVGCSNNTIRAAMTPKYKDPKNLIEVLNYRMTDQEEYLVRPESVSGCPHVDEYSPDCRDFQLHRVRIPRGVTETNLPALDCGSIMVIHSGSATLASQAPSPSSLKHRSYNQFADDYTEFEVKRGDIFYISPGKRLRFLNCTENLEGFRTFSFEEGPDHQNRTVLYGKRHLNGIDFDPLPIEEIQTSERERPRFGLGNNSETLFAPAMEMDGFM